MSTNGNAFIITGLSYIVYSGLLHSLLSTFGIAAGNSAPGLPVKFFDSLTILKKDRVLVCFSAGGGLTQIAFAPLAPLSSHLAATFEEGVLVFSWLMTVNAAVVVITQSLFRPFLSDSRRFGVPIWGICFMLLEASDLRSENVAGLILVMVVYTSGEVLCFPSGTILIDQLAPAHLRGSYYGAHNFKELGRFICPSLGMFTLTDFGIRPLFWIIALILVLSSLVFWMGDRKRMRRKEVRALLKETF
ncbi:hypothetical protein [Bacillus sp. AK031]